MRILNVLNENERLVNNTDSDGVFHGSFKVATVTLDDGSTWELTDYAFVDWECFGEGITHDELWHSGWIKLDSTPALAMRTYNYDADTECSWVTHEFNLDNLNGREFMTDSEVDELSGDILDTIYSTEYTVIGILADYGDVIWFITK